MHSDTAWGPWFRHRLHTALRRSARPIAAIYDVRLGLSQRERAEAVDLDTLVAIAVEIKHREDELRQRDCCVGRAVLEGEAKSGRRASVRTDHAKHAVAAARLLIGRRREAAERLDDGHDEIKRHTIHIADLRVSQLSRAAVRTEASQVLNMRPARCASCGEIQSYARGAR